MSNSPNLDLDRLVEGQVQGEITYNQAINKLDSLVHMAVEQRDLSAPPGSPSDGDRYLIASGATGAWATHDGEIGIYYDGWDFLVPQEGWRLWIKDEDSYLVYDGTGWVALSALGGMQDPVLDKDLTAPPGSPSTGDRYIVGPSATGAWAGEDDNIAQYDGASWAFTDATDGMTVFVLDEDEIYAYQSTAWFQKTGVGGAGSTRYDAVIRRSDYGSDTAAGTALKSALENAAYESVAVEGGTFEITSSVTQAANQMVDCDPEVVIKLNGAGLNLAVGSECTIREGKIEGTGSAGNGANGLVYLADTDRRLERIRVTGSAGDGVVGNASPASGTTRKTLDNVRSDSHTGDGFADCRGLNGCYSEGNGGDGYDGCDHVELSTADGNTGDGFFQCDYLDNVLADGNTSDGFHSCTRLSVAIANNNTAYGYNSCAAIGMHEGTGNGSGLYNAGTNILKSNILDALDGATSPSSSNPFITFNQNDVGTGELKTATGSFSGNVPNTGAGVTVTMNDYAFFPRVNVTAGAAQDIRMGAAIGSTADTVGEFSLTNTTGTTRVSNVRWRYMTASDNPQLWVARDATGAIVAVWESEDPSVGVDGKELTPIKYSDAGITVEKLDLPTLDLVKQVVGNLSQAKQQKVVARLIQVSERRGLGTPESLDDIAGVADERMRRVLTLHTLRRMSLEDDAKTLSQWIFDNMKVIDGKLVLQ